VVWRMALSALFFLLGSQLSWTAVKALAAGLMIATWLAFAVGIAIVTGTQIRVRVEDSLLRSRFGDQFRNYQRSVAAYLPMVR